MRFFLSGCARMPVSSTKAQTLVFLFLFQTYGSHSLGSFRQSHLGCTVQPSAKDLQGHHMDFQGPLLYSFLLSSALPCRFQLFKFRTLFSQFSEPAGLCLDSSSLCCFWLSCSQAKSWTVGVTLQIFLLSEVAGLHCFFSNV